MVISEKVGEAPLGYHRFKVSPLQDFFSHFHSNVGFSSLSIPETKVTRTNSERDQEKPNRSSNTSQSIKPIKKVPALLSLLINLIPEKIKT